MRKEEEIQSSDDLISEVREWVISHRALLGGAAIGGIAFGTLAVVELLRRKRKSLEPELRPIAEELKARISAGADVNLLTIPITDEVGMVIEQTNDEQSIGLLQRINQGLGFPSGGTVREEVLVTAAAIASATKAFIEAFFKEK